MNHNPFIQSLVPVLGLGWERRLDVVAKVTQGGSKLMVRSGSAEVGQFTWPLTVGNQYLHDANTVFYLRAMAK